MIDMEEVEKWKRINSCETHEELKKAIIEIADNDNIQGSKKSWKASYQSDVVQFLWENPNIEMNMLTRSYGIRQQMMYLLYYR